MSTAVKTCVLVGPTAVGKSVMAMHLATVFNGEIINADSLQLCRRLTVGTAKPSVEEMRQIPHHLYDVIEPGEQLNAADYAKLASQAIHEVAARRRLPILVGGSGFYLRALFHGLAVIPSVDDEIKNKINILENEKGLTFLYEQLKNVDAETADRLHPNDVFRIRRALEVYEATGRPLSAYHRDSRLGDSDLAEPLMLGLHLPRQQLYERINARVVQMFTAQPGILAEVKQFAPGKERGIGYDEAAAVLQGRMDLQTAIVSTAQRTRHYAKRQMTWFRNDKAICWFDMNDSERMAKIEQMICDYLA